jgi:predicted O-methyltransferase YrrM
MAITTTAEVLALTGRLPAGVSPERGEELYRFIREHRPVDCLELGVGHGGSALYIAAGLEANGAGSLTTVDRLSARTRHPQAGELIDRAGLSGRVKVVYEETSYTWYLHDVLRSQLTGAGVVEPCYDFVFIDGSHLWDVDALAFALADRLLRPGGWILFDDLDWRLDERWEGVPAYQRELAQVGEIWELLVVTDTGYDVFRYDGQWGWARKSATASAPSRLLIKRDVVGGALSLARTARARLRAAARGTSPLRPSP